MKNGEPTELADFKGLESGPIGVSKIPPGYAIGFPNGGYIASFGYCDVGGNTVAEAIGNLLVELKRLYAEIEPKDQMPYITDIWINEEIPEILLKMAKDGNSNPT